MRFFYDVKYKHLVNKASATQVKYKMVTSGHNMEARTRPHPIKKNRPDIFKVTSLLSPPGAIFGDIYFDDRRLP